MRQVIDVLKELKGKEVDIYTKHALYGAQHIRMDFEPEIEIGLGFRCKGQAIYISNDDVVDCDIQSGYVCINGNMMSIKIVYS